MSIANVNNGFVNVYQYTKKTSKTENAENTSFSARKTNTDGKQGYTSAVEDYKERHPNDAYVVDNYVRAGKKVLEKNNACDVDRSNMTMEEYKSFFKELMDSIPYDSSQCRDVNVWSITEKGWEQMKNDSDYEAWVLGYTSTDRSFHNPWASMPGYSPCFHTEHFGASIDEHLGQGIPMKSSAAEKSDSDDGESWWEKRHKRLEEILEEQAKKAQMKKAARRQQMLQEWEQQAFESRQRMAEYFNSRAINSDVVTGANVSPQMVTSAVTAYDKSIMEVTGNSGNNMI